MINQMTKTERVRAAVRFEEVDRIPISLWPHFTDVDQDYERLARAQFQHYQMLDLDFVKLMPFGLYGVEDYGVKIEKFYLPDQWPQVAEEFIKTDGDWERIVPLDVKKGTYGDQLHYARRMLELMEETGDRAPVIHTIFSPLTTLYKLIGEKKLLSAIGEEPDKVHGALAAIAETTIQFVKENIDLGISGFFFASQLANYRFMDDPAYDEFGERYDRQVFAAYQDQTWFNVVHIHSFTQQQEMAMFTRLMNYPANCANWHDRWTGPSIAEARSVTDKCLIGGINEEQYFNKVDYREVYAHVRQGLELGGRKGYMVGPGCTIYEDTPIVNYMAARLAVEKYGRL